MGSFLSTDKQFEKKKEEKCKQQGHEHRKYKTAEDEHLCKECYLKIKKHCSICSRRTVKYEELNLNRPGGICARCFFIKWHPSTSQTYLPDSNLGVI